MLDSESLLTKEKPTWIFSSERAANAEGGGGAGLVGIFLGGNFTLGTGFFWIVEEEDEEEEVEAVGVCGG